MTNDIHIYTTIHTSTWW